VAAFRRNSWQVYSGITGRLRPEYAPPSGINDIPPSGIEKDKSNNKNLIIPYFKKEIKTIDTVTIGENLFEFRNDQTILDGKKIRDLDWIKKLGETHELFIKAKELYQEGTVLD